MMSYIAPMRCVYVGVFGRVCEQAQGLISAPVNLSAWHTQQVGAPHVGAGTNARSPHHVAPSLGRLHPCPCQLFHACPSVPELEGWFRAVHVGERWRVEPQDGARAKLTMDAFWCVCVRVRALWQGRGTCMHGRCRCRWLAGLSRIVLPAVRNSGGMQRLGLFPGQNRWRVSRM
jgi:hypothetical protein